MGLGDFGFDLVADPHVNKEAKRYRHLLVYEDERLIYCGLILRLDPSSEKITIGGRLPTWRLGVDKSGLLIRDKTYLSGVSALSNGEFDLGTLYWSAEDGTPWYVNQGVAVVGANPPKDAPLTSQESKAAVSGETWYGEAQVVRPAGIAGRLRVCVVFEGQNFDHPDLLAGLTWADHSDTSGDAATSGGDLVIGPTTQRQYVVNTGFEDAALDGWTQGTTGWGVSTASFGVAPHSGIYMATCIAVDDPDWGQYHWLQADTDSEIPGTNAVSVKPGEQYRLEGYVAGFIDGADPSPTGFGYLLLLLVNDRYPASGYQEELASDKIDLSHPTPTDMATWQYLKVDYDVPTARTDQGEHQVLGIIPHLIAATLLAGTANAFCFDDVKLTRLQGNEARLSTPRVSVIPGQAHDLLVAVEADTAMSTGTLKFSVLLEDSLGNRDPVVVESGTVDYKAKSRTLLPYTFTPPSGYDRATVSLVGTDIAGGSFRTFGKPTLVFSDASRWIFQASTLDQQPTLKTVNLNATAPAGTEKVHLEIVADDLAAGWEVASTALIHQGAKTLVSEVLNDCLFDFDNLRHVIEPGVIHAGTSEYLTHDVRALRWTNAELLAYLCRSGVAPAREYRYNPDNTLDYGTTAELFADRKGFVLRPHQLEVLELPDVQETSEEEVDEVLVIGATVKDFRGRETLITGSASRVIDARDWNDQPSHRVLVVEESTMDTARAADAWASYVLNRNNARQSVTLSLSDWRGYADGEFDVGDTIYPEDPESGLVGDTQMVDPKTGESCWPLPSRVLERTRKLGGGFRAEIRREDGTIYEIPDELVLWENETSASVTVGDFLPEFAVDPQGLAASVQFTRFRASMPR